MKEFDKKYLIVGLLPVLLTALLVAILLCYYRTCSPNITVDIASIICTSRFA
jgi:hypothetical protein